MDYSKQIMKMKEEASCGDSKHEEDQPQEDDAVNSRGGGECKDNERPTMKSIK